MRQTGEDVLLRLLVVFGAQPCGRTPAPSFERNRPWFLARPEALLAKWEFLYVGGAFSDPAEENQRTVRTQVGPGAANLWEENV